MTFEEFISWLGFTNKVTFWGVIVFLTSIGIEIFPKIKWNPWSSLIKWIGSKFNDKIDAKIDALNKSMDSKIQSVDEKVDKLQSDLSAHVLESENKNLQDIRREPGQTGPFNGFRQVTPSDEGVPRQTGPSALGDDRPRISLIIHAP